MKNLPEKIYATPNFDRRWQTKAIDDESVEYTSTDAFFEKAKEWFIKRNEWIDLDGNRQCDMESFEDFINYMKGE